MGNFQVSNIILNRRIRLNHLQLAIADFNNDNHLDIVVANNKSNNIWVFWGYGRGVFRGQDYLFDGIIRSDPVWVAVNDLNE